MELVLAPEEKVVKSWKVATLVGEANAQTTSSVSSNVELTITDKRVVMNSQAAGSVKRDEVLLKDVVGVSVQQKKTTNNPSKTASVAVGIILILLAVVMLVLAGNGEEVDLPEEGQIAFTILGIIVAVIAFVCLFAKIQQTNMAFSINIHTRASSNVVSF